MSNASDSQRILVIVWCATCSDESWRDGVDGDCGRGGCCRDTHIMWGSGKHGHCGHDNFVDAVNTQESSRSSVIERRFNNAVQPKRQCNQPHVLDNVTDVSGHVTEAPVTILGTGSVKIARDKYDAGAMLQARQQRV
jgi:hypothetical protein